MSPTERRRPVHGVLAEPAAIEGTGDIGAFGGWRAHVASRAADAPEPA